MGSFIWDYDFVITLVILHTHLYRYLRSAAGTAKFFIYTFRPNYKYKENGLVAGLFFTICEQVALIIFMPCTELYTHNLIFVFGLHYKERCTLDQCLE